MTPAVTRFVCGVLSTIGAAGLVAFANPANAVGAMPHAIRSAAVTPAVTTAAVAMPAARG